MLGVSSQARNRDAEALHDHDGNDPVLQGMRSMTSPVVVGGIAVDAEGPEPLDLVGRALPQRVDVQGAVGYQVAGDDERSTATPCAVDDLDVALEPGDLGLVVDLAPPVAELGVEDEPGGQLDLVW